MPGLLNIIEIICHWIMTLLGKDGRLLKSAEEF